MLEIRKLESTEPLLEMKHAYVQQATDPLDGMWLCGFVPMATHFGFYDEAELVGFCCANDQGYLLQFYLPPRHQNRSSHLFEEILKSTGSPIPKISGAFVSTAEPRFLSLCADHFSAFEVNALMYQLESPSSGHPHDASMALPVLEPAQLSEAVGFANAAIGAPENWLKGYYSNLIRRQELYGRWENERLVATGESRGFDYYQTECADLGVIVAESERGKGLATRILKQLVSMNEIRGLRSICSTEKGNLGAQKAIRRAGFFASHRILEFKD